MTKLPLDCFTDQSEVEHIKEEVVFCSNDGVTFNGTAASVAKLPPYSLKDPLPTTDSCTISSILSPAWRLSLFETTSGNGSTGSVQFNIEIKTNDIPSEYPQTIMQSGIHLATTNDTTWYSCAFAPGDILVAPSNCTFQYNSKSRQLSLKAQWTCDDLDISQP
jgi:hypothetical protein